MRLLVQVATGPENPTRAALGLLAARTAAEEGHEVRLFLAGDGVQLARPETAAGTQGIGSGSVAEHWEALAESRVPVFLSGLSSKARGIGADTKAGAELVQPTKLVELVAWADSSLVY
ncbi:MAG: DsrE family protein [Gaiellaceae bacterium]